MKTLKSLIKRNYTKPQIKKICIDNEISLVMMSEGTIPTGPPWDRGSIYHTKQDPYKTNLT